MPKLQKRDFNLLDLLLITNQANENLNIIIITHEPWLIHIALLNFPRFSYGIQKHKLRDAPSLFLIVYTQHLFSWESNHTLVNNQQIVYDIWCFYTSPNFSWMSLPFFFSLLNCLVPLLTQNRTPSQCFLHL